MGVFGIFLATAIARLVTNTWYEPYALFKHGFGKNPTLYLKKYLFFLIVLLMSGGVCYGLCWLCSYCINSLLLVILFKVIICTVVSNGIFALVFHRSKEFAYLWNVVKEALRKITGRFKKNKV